MGSRAQSHRSFFSLPRDFAKRRRLRRRIADAIIVPLLGLLAGYAITRPTGGGGYSPPKSSAAAMQSTTNSATSSAETKLLPAFASDLQDGSLPSAQRGSGTEGLYKSGDGPYQVDEVPDIVLRDAKRNKDLHVRIFYPQSAGHFPLIVFSHDAGGSQNCCEALTRHWAANGYVTLQPTHKDSFALRRNGGDGNVVFVKAVREALQEPALWEARPQDISFILDSLPALQKRVPALDGKMDAQPVGVGGHSMGAFTADAVGGALVNLPGRPGTSFADSRVGAVLLLSPPGPGEFGLTDHSWDRVTVPLMSMTGSLDRAANRQGPDWKKIPFERSQPGDKYHVFLNGANHMSFISAKTTQPGNAVQSQAILDYTNSAALAFWDAYLKKDAAAKRYLHSNALPDASQGAARLFRR